MPTKKKNINPDIDTDIDLEVDELIRNNPKLAKYIDELKNVGMPLKRRRSFTI